MPSGRPTGRARRPWSRCPRTGPRGRGAAGGATGGAAGGGRGGGRGRPGGRPGAAGGAAPGSRAVPTCSCTETRSTTLRSTRGMRRKRYQRLERSVLAAETVHGPGTVAGPWPARPAHTMRPRAAPVGALTSFDRFGGRPHPSRCSGDACAGSEHQSHAPRAAPPPGHPGPSSRATTHRRDRARTYPRTGQERFSPDMMSSHTLARRPAAPLSLAGRAADARRRRRRQVGDPRLYCGTNGCPTILDLDPRTGIAACPICGFARRLA